MYRKGVAHDCRLLVARVGFRVAHVEKPWGGPWFKLFVWVGSECSAGAQGHFFVWLPLRQYRLDIFGWPALGVRRRCLFR